MPEPIEDKQVLKALTLQYGEGAASYAWAKLPTWKSDCRAERAIKKSLREKYVKQYNELRSTQHL